METGATTLAFTPVKQHETELSGGVSSSGNNNIVINLDFEDVDAAYEVNFQLLHASTTGPRTGRLSAAHFTTFVS